MFQTSGRADRSSKKMLLCDPNHIFEDSRVPASSDMRTASIDGLRSFARSGTNELRHVVRKRPARAPAKIARLAVVGLSALPFATPRRYQLVFHAEQLGDLDEWPL